MACENLHFVEEVLVFLAAVAECRLRLLRFCDIIPSTFDPYCLRNVTSLIRVQNKHQSFRVATINEGKSA